MRSVIAAEVQPAFAELTERNAALNGIGADRFRVYAGDILADSGMRAALGTNFDIVLANIVADVILPLAPLSREFLAPGGTFVTSGIIEGRQDEIEAALDEVNVERLAQYIKRYSHGTQFIMITHRRGTMAAADRLYGVTMPEHGISKVLMLNINDISKKEGEDWDGIFG